MSRTPKYSPKKIIQCIKDTAGLKTEIASRVGCTRMTLDRYLKDYPEIKEAYQEELDAVGDMARGALFEAIEQRQPWAVMFYLDRKDPEYKRTAIQEEDTPMPTKLVIEVSGGQPAIHPE